MSCPRNRVWDPARSGTQTAWFFFTHSWWPLLTLSMPVSASPETPCSEEALLRAAQAGQSWAWYRLVEAHQGMVYALVRRWGHQEDADDVFQEVFLRVHKYLKGFRHEASFKTWLHRIAMNTLKDWAKQKQSRAGFEVQEGSGEAARQPNAPSLDQFPAEVPDPHRILDDQVRLGIVRELFAELSAMDREILLLRDLAGHNYEEIANLLGLELGTVKSRIFRARKALMGLFVQKGLVHP